MFRIQLSTASQPDFGYHSTDLDQVTFGRIVTGQPVLAQGEGQDRISIEDVYYCAIWNPDVCEYVNNLTPDQVPAAYVAYAREIYP